MSPSGITPTVGAGRHLGRLRIAVVAGFVGVMALAAPLGSFAATASGACPTRSGVTVVVDFGPYGGVSTACAPDTDTGLDALEAAGFSWAGTAQFWDFVCRINGLPTAEDDACVRTPPASAYWTYWHAERGGGWVYSSQSASVYDPSAGSVEGWAFGAGAAPASSPPPTIPPSTPPPPPPPPPTTNPPHSGPTSPGPGEETAPATAAASAPASTPVASSAPSTSGSTAGTTPESSRPGTISAGDPTTGSAASGGSGSPLGTVIGLIAAAAVAAAGGVVVLRRRE